MSLEDLSGWIGAILVLVAYYMVSSGKSNANSPKFQLINIIGATFLIYYTYSCQAFASMSVNIIWVIIGIQSYSKLFRMNNISIKLSQLLLGSESMKLKTKLFCALLSSIFIFTVSVNTIAQDSDDEQSMGTDDEVSEEISTTPVIDTSDDESSEGDAE